VACQVSVAGDRQFTLLELLLNHLPATDGLLAVNGCDATAVNLQIGRQGLCVGLKSLVELLGLGRNRCEGRDIANGVGSGEFGVWQEAASELVEALADLEAR
jgi:hypothetical protein